MCPVFYLFFVLAAYTPITLSIRLTLVDASAVATLWFAATAVLRRGEFGFELVDVTTGFAYEPAEVPGHPREFARAEDYQEEKPDDYHLLCSDAEHRLNAPFPEAGQAVVSQISVARINNWHHYS
jgi:hypothetical protein